MIKTLTSNRPTMPARFLPDAQSHHTQKEGWHGGCLFSLAERRVLKNTV